jgi:hypothetical protein
MYFIIVMNSRAWILLFAPSVFHFYAILSCCSWLNLARLRILQRRAPELFKVLRSALLRYRVRVFVSKTRAHTALIKVVIYMHTSFASLQE